MLKMKSAAFPAPFTSGLEYSAPARGTWNIVHTGMLLPEAHQIFVCAAGCLRGVVLTAAEMNASNRFSTIAIRENNVLDGDMEDLIIDGVMDIINGLNYRPRAILLYTSCIHHFMGCDMKMVFNRLREHFPEIKFTDCYMNPIMRKSGLTPDQLMRRQLYSLLENRPKNNKVINIIGNDIKTSHSSELFRILEDSDYKVQEIHDFKTFDDYMNMSDASFNILYNPAVKAAGQALQLRIQQQPIYIPLSFNYNEIITNYKLLADTLGITMPDLSEDITKAEASLTSAHDVIGDIPIAIDYTLTLRPAGLARLLLEHGFNVTRLYVDSFTSDDKEDFEWLKLNAPELDLYATVHTMMRVLSRHPKENFLALGQKAAYFTGTDHFVNIVEGGGLYGFDGICQMSDLMKDAFINTKDTQSLIQIKGLGCGGCS